MLQRWNAKLRYSSAEKKVNKPLLYLQTETYQGLFDQDACLVHTRDIVTWSHKHKKKTLYLDTTCYRCEPQMCATY